MQISAPVCVGSVLANLLTYLRQWITDKRVYNGEILLGFMAGGQGEGRLTRQLDAKVK